MIVVLASLYLHLWVQRQSHSNYYRLGWPILSLQLFPVRKSYSCKESLNYIGILLNWTDFSQLFQLLNSRWKFFKLPRNRTFSEDYLRILLCNLQQFRYSVQRQVEFLPAIPKFLCSVWCRLQRRCELLSGRANVSSIFQSHPVKKFDTNFRYFNQSKVSDK